MTKTEAREYVKSIKNNMTKEEVCKKSVLVMDKLFELPEFVTADNIFTYVSYNQEVETFGLIEKSLSLGKNVFVPKVYGKEIKFHKIDSLALLNSGKYGILEPCNEFLDEWNNVSGTMIMPGLAFGRDFSRVGYGGGFYDRYLSSRSGLVTVAVCFDFQLFESIEIEEFDYRPDVIISDKEVISRILY